VGGAIDVVLAALIATALRGVTADPALRDVVQSLGLSDG
jgi:hypothetical protein